MYRSDRDSSQIIALLSHLTVEELKGLVSDDDKFTEFMKDQMKDKDLDAEKEMLLASNRSLAEFNLSREKELNEGKCQLQQLSDEGAQALKIVESKVAELREKSNNTDAEIALARLQTATAEMEEQSEAIAAKFLDGDMDIETFLESFENLRKLMHLRRAKADKMSDLLSKRNKRGNDKPQVWKKPDPPESSNYQPPAPPYPTATFNMPLPTYPLFQS